MKKTLFIFLALLLFGATVTKGQDKNITFEVTTGQSMMEYGYWKMGTILPGDYVDAIAEKFLTTPPASFEGQPVIGYIEVLLNDEIIHRHAFKFTYPEYNRWRFSLIPDPYSNVSITFRHDWNGNFNRALAKLPKGKHLLKVKSYLEKDNERILVGYGEIDYDNTGGGDIDMIKIADLIDQNATFDPQKEMADWIQKNGGADAWRKANDADLAKSDAEDAKREAQNYYKITAVNNCNDSYTLTVNDAQTYVINGKSSLVISVARGKAGVIKRNGTVVATVAENQENGTVVICQ
jgi:hypothetical protein